MRMDTLPLALTIGMMIAAKRWPVQLGLLFILLLLLAACAAVLWFIVYFGILGVIALLLVCILIALVNRDS